MDRVCTCKIDRPIFDFFFFVPVYLDLVSWNFSHMLTSIKVISLTVFLYSYQLCLAQPQKYSTANAHSHNDYLNATPFYLAFKNGFGSIEADIFSVNDTLFVAHSKAEITSGRTLSDLYIKPLVRALDSNKSRRLILLIDIKDNYKISLPLLVKELEPLKKNLSSQVKKNNVTIVISGNRPSPSEFKDYPDFIFFDDDLKPGYTKNEWERVGLVSLPFTRITRWNGKDNLKAEDSRRLKQVIDSVHQAGKPIRFWAAPDSELSWEKQASLGVDLIGTDKISELAEFLRRKRNP
jgi:alkaline phosphatase